MKKSILKNILGFLIFFLFISSFLSLFSFSSGKTTEITIDQLVNEIKSSEVEKIIVEENKLNIILKDGRQQFATKESTESAITLLHNLGVSNEELTSIVLLVKDTSSKNFWLYVLLIGVLPLVLIFIFFWFFSRRMQTTGTQIFKFGESGAREVLPENNRSKISFKDVAGLKEAKEELEEVVEFLKNPKKFIDLGAKIPKGVLLTGAPGCGKTLLARAVAGEANVPFYHISGSEFVEMFVGVGASRVRSLFSKAKKNAPAIIFIDELDAVGRARGTGLGGSHDEREQTLNQILVELNGFEPNIGLIVISATNRPDILDPALLRPGRFDRKIILDLPDINEREKILEIHSRKKPLAKDVSLKDIAERTPGFSGADLANLINEAAIRAAKASKKEINQIDILESIEKVVLGPERRSHIITEREKKIIAFHEAGHAVASHFLPNCDPVRKISIISRGQAAGYTLRMPKEDKYLHSKNEFLDNIASLLAGYISEKIFLKNITTGAANDLRQATEMSKDLVCQYGMSEKLGPRTFGKTQELVFLGKEISEEKDYSQKTSEIIDQEINEIINFCYKKAEEILKNNKTIVKKVASKLLEKETLEQKEFLAILNEDDKENNKKIS
ncbi:MAG: ATP-dependent zinc metalloprotease FtsH [Parcubacteria group bacterium ADurb.Bin159]|nr:MAG: ATP-dependent zinc metalloprotease FtsH [Parcubacteria group bacterium ADurb.Bin159]